jgi:biotin carboxylase
VQEATVDVVMISPGYPKEMAYFTRGLAAVGARVIGVGDQPVHDMPPEARDALAHHEHVQLSDTQAVVDAVRGLAQHADIQLVECLWEPYMLLAAQLRTVLGVPGMSPEQTLLFRDKEAMKATLDAAGIRTPHHYRATRADEVREYAERIGYPVILKPIAGAGSADTHRCDSRDELEAAIASTRHVPEVSVEEFVEAEEFTYDTVCAGGRILFENIGLYRPRPLQMAKHEWVSPVYIGLRDITVEHVAGGREMGHRVLDALGFQSGYTHMEWYRKSDGEVVFGEIGARPPGARTVDVMNYVTDADLYTGWAEAVVHGRISQDTSHKYNAASIFKRAVGQGRISGVEGLSRLMAEYGEHVVALELAPIGTPRADWTRSITGDGMIMVRHPDLALTMEMAERFASEVRLHAG